jgi:hypothetical protein
MSGNSYIDPYNVDSDCTEDDDATVIVECNVCLSTTGRSYCICSAHERYGLEDERCLSTQDWQEYEYQQNLSTFRQQERLRLEGDFKFPRVEEDVWMEEIGTGKWILAYRAEVTVLDLAKAFKQRVPRDVWRLIGMFFNKNYYNTCREVKYLLFCQLFDAHRKEVHNWMRLMLEVPQLAYDAPCRGYCMRCGDPAINKNLKWPTKRGQQSYVHRLTQTCKYGLGVMGLCHKCMKMGFQYDRYHKEVFVPVGVMQTVRPVRR